MTSPLSYTRVRSWLNDVRAEAYSYVPTEVGDHLTNAKKELLAAARGVIDEQIRWSDRQWEMAKAKRAERQARAAQGESAAQTPPSTSERKKG